MQKAIYTTVGIDELLLHVQALKVTAGFNETAFLT